MIYWCRQELDGAMLIRIRRSHRNHPISRRLRIRLRMLLRLRLRSRRSWVGRAIMLRRGVRRGRIVRRRKPRIGMMMTMGSRRRGGRLATGGIELDIGMLCYSGLQRSSDWRLVGLASLVGVTWEGSLEEGYIPKGYMHGTKYRYFLGEVAESGRHHLPK